MFKCLSFTLFDPKSREIIDFPQQLANQNVYLEGTYIFIRVTNLMFEFSQLWWGEMLSNILALTFYFVMSSWANVFGELSKAVVSTFEHWNRTLRKDLLNECVLVILTDATFTCQQFVYRLVDCDLQVLQLLIQTRSSSGLHSTQPDSCHIRLTSPYAVTPVRRTPCHHATVPLDITANELFLARAQPNVGHRCFILFPDAYLPAASSQMCLNVTRWLLARPLPNKEDSETHFPQPCECDCCGMFSHSGQLRVSIQRASRWAGKWGIQNSRNGILRCSRIPEYLPDENEVMWRLRLPLIIASSS